MTSGNVTWVDFEELIPKDIGGSDHFGYDVDITKL